jgi:protein-S-isoprenylcysteine O-methyltransferase Ste14
MYGFPLTVYLLSGWLGSGVPGLSTESHNQGHLWQVFLNLGGDPHINPLHLLSDAFLVAGFILLYFSWRVLYKAQRCGKIATSGPYRFVRHPQYGAFVIILSAFVLQWPTIPTVVLYPLLVTMYARLARQEERDALAAFGEDYLSYLKSTSAFLPRVNAVRLILSFTRSVRSRER